MLSRGGWLKKDKDLLHEMVYYFRSLPIDSWQAFLKMASVPRMQSEMGQMNSEVENEKSLMTQLWKMVKELQMIIYQIPCVPEFKPLDDDRYFNDKLSAKSHIQDLKEELEDENSSQGAKRESELTSPKTWKTYMRI
ncbi:myosin-15 [Ictidomys tridecemlineatus]